MAKRANGEGSIYYNEKRKRFEGQFPYWDRMQNKMCRKMFVGQSLKEVAAKGKQFLQEREQGVDFKSSQKQLKEWLDFWLENFVVNQVKIKTYERYNCAIHQHIIPQLGHLELSQLNTEHLQRHFQFLKKKGGVLGKGLAPRTINSARRILIAALEDAADLGYLAKNVARKTKAIKADKPPMYILSHEEGTKLLACSKEYDPVAWIAVELALGTGMRIGEIFGMTWKCIDLEKGILRVEQTVVVTNKGSQQQGNAKTLSSRRTIPLPQSVIAALREFQIWQQKYMRMMGDKYVDRGYLITNSTGKYRDSNSFSYRTFKKLLRLAGIESNMRFHDLRHTHATWLLADNVNVKVVSERLGHSSIRITLDTYGHVLKGMQDKAVESIENILHPKDE